MSKWWWKADYIETCNCTHGCSCNLTMLPTDGTCQGLNCWQIREGAYNGTRLDGLGIALINRWPNPIHRGNGRGVVFIDERADDAQREALSEIGSGKAGLGGPFELFATTMSEPATVRFGRFRFEREGRHGLVELGDVARVRLGPIKSDMDQSEADVHMVLPGGFIWRDGRMLNTDQCEVTFPGLQFHHANSSAFFSEVEYNVVPPDRVPTLVRSPGANPK
jgi:hypothetical protein